MLDGHYKATIDRFWDVAAGGLVRLGLTPNQVTWAGLGLVVLNCGLYAWHRDTTWLGVGLSVAFAFDALEAAKSSLQRIRDFRVRLAEVNAPSGDDLKERVKSCEEAFVQALDDDLNISAGLGAAFDFIRDVNKSLDQFAVSAEGARSAQHLLDRLDALTGLFPRLDDDQIPPAGHAERQGSLAQLAAPAPVPCWLGTALQVTWSAPAWQVAPLAQ